ncbi:hypothetical protein WN944_029255 [Citrus x changshan-huyou]|uniref:Uncharacterized protein n=1 Tax=Citrus x changshan-huyou TaxID=2935761 RepID=A0AAP0LLB1_9ROSI
MGHFHALQERGKAAQTQLMQGQCGLSRTSIFFPSQIGTKQWQYYEFGPEVVPELVCLPRMAGAIEVYYKQIHEGEQKKRSNQIESAGGKVRVLLVGNYSIKMEKYKMAASAILTPKVGYGFADELKTAWFWVRKVLDKPHDVDVYLRNYMVDMVD